LNVKLLAYQRAFLEPFIEWRNQALSLRHNPLKTMTRTEIAQMLESEGSELKELRKYESYRWFVGFDEEVVGSVSLKSISHSMGYAEIGYGISETHHRRGIATVAVGLLVDKVFAETTLRKLIAMVHDQNQASCRVLEKLGFQEEGLLREHYVINGEAKDEVLYGLLRREWREGIG